MSGHVSVNKTIIKNRPIKIKDARTGSGTLFSRERVDYSTTMLRCRMYHKAVRLYLIPITTTFLHYVIISLFSIWLVGCFGFNGPLRQYFSLYRAVSQREGERRERIDES